MLKFSPSMVVAEKSYAADLDVFGGATCSASGYWNCCVGACWMVRTTGGGAAAVGVFSPDVPTMYPMAPAAMTATTAKAVPSIGTVISRLPSLWSLSSQR